MVPDSVRVLAPALAREQALEPEPEPVRAQVSGLALAPATAWVREQSGRVRRFHNLILRFPQSPGIPLITKSSERWTKSSP